jgi:transposase
MSHALGVSPTAIPMSSSESVDDIPLLLAHLQRLGVQRLIDTHFPEQSGAAGLSTGWIVLLWLSHMLSQSGRQIRQLRAWVAAHQATLAWLLEQPVHPGDISDTRLREVLRVLDDDTCWPAFEAALNQHLLRLYRVRPEGVRIGRSASLWYVTSEGTLQFDQTRRWWPGAMQVQLTLATLDPYGLPATTWFAPADQAGRIPLEIVAQTRSALPGRQMLFIGNGELGSLEIRSAIQAGQDAYLCMLSGEEALLELKRAAEHGDAALAVGGSVDMLASYERSHVVYSEPPELGAEWVERRLLLRSHRYAEEQSSELAARLARAQRALATLNEKRRGKRRPRTLAAMREVAESILAEHGVADLVALSYEEVRRYRGRPTTTRVDRMVLVASSVDEQALAATRERLGWQVYATSLPAEMLTSDQAARACGEPDRGFERLRGRPLSLLPGVIQRTDHVRGLVRLLGIGLRGLALLDMAAGLHSADLSDTAGQRAGALLGSNSPAAERLLETFRDITLTSVSDGKEQRAHLTALSALQRRVLDWLALSPDTYRLRS